MFLTEQYQIVTGLAPAADRFNGSPATDVVNTKYADKVTFLIEHSGGTSGYATLTVEECDNVTPSNTKAIAFNYRKKTTGASAAWGDITAATTSGVATTAAGDQIIEIQVDPAALTAGYPYVRLKCTETVDDPVNGAVQIILGPMAYQSETETDVLT